MLKMLCRLYWWRLRTQPVQEALAAVGIAAGVALIFAVTVANTSVPASVRELIHGVDGRGSIEVAARSPEGFDQRVLATVGHAPGVMGAAAVLDSRVTVIGPRGELALTLLGAEPAIGFIGGPIARRFSTRSLRNLAPAGTPEAALPTVALPEAAARAIGAAAGERLSVDVGGRAVAVLCSAVLGKRQVGAVVESPVVISLLPAAQTITGLHGRATRILVLPKPGDQALTAGALTRILGGDLDVRSSGSEVSLLEAATHSSNQVASLFTALSVVVGLLFAYNAMLLTLPARRRFVARLRGMGVYRSELAGLLALEVLVLGFVASVIGLALGDVLSAQVFGSVPGYLAAGFAIGTQRVITPVAVLAAVGGGMLATCVAAVGPAMGSLRGRPLEESSAATGTPRLLGLLAGPGGLAAGVSAIAATVIVVLLVPGSGLVGVGVLAVGLGFVLAPAVPWLVARISVLSSRLRSPLSYIATTELRAAPTRATALAATSAIAVFAIVALGGAANDIRRGAANASYDIAGDSALLVWPGPFDEYPFPVQPLDATTALARLRSVSAISRVDVLRGSFLDLGDRRLLVIAKPLDDSTPVSSSQIIEGSARRAAALIRQGGWVALSEIVAAERHVHVGGRLLLPTPSGYEAFRLAATITNYGWPPGAMVMSATDYIRDWHTERATGLRVFLRQGIAEDTGLRAVRAALSGTGLFVNTTRRAEADIKSVTNQGLSQLNQISLLVLAAAILAVVAAMSGSIWQRRPRLAGLRRLGLYRWELIRTIYLETGVVVVVGCTIGAGFGLGAQPIATGYVRQSTGFPEIYSPAVWLGVRTLAVATILAMLATGVLGYVVTRRSLGWRSEA